MDPLTQVKFGKTLLPWLHFKTDHALHREDNKAEFLNGQFVDEKLPFLHKERTEHSFNPFALGDFAKKCVLKLVEWFSGHCCAIKS